MNRQPPPPPYPHNTNLPHPRQLQSRGETDISYDAYSPSPSSLSAHRNKYNRIQDWAVYNTINRSRQLAGMARHDPSMGIGTASWSDTGTGITGDRSDVGTVPTTVRDARGGGGGREGPREKVDVRREMSENRAKQDQAQAQIRGVQRKPSRLGQEMELEASELPYRQSSLRRDDARPQANGSAPDKTKTKPPAAPKPAPQRPQLVHSKSTKPPPTPLLARPPTPPKDIPLIPGTPRVTSPESDRARGDGKGNTMSPWAVREAYLESALTLPIDMLSQVQREKEKYLQTPATALKTAKSTSSISSGVTMTRLASLLGNKVSPKSGDQRLNGEGVRQMGSSKTLGSKASRTPLAPVETPAPNEPVRQAKSQSSKPKLPTFGNPEIPRSLGSAPPLSRSTTVPANHKTKLQTAANEPSALGLTLGPELPPAPHRQLIALRRPALTPGNSTENLLAMPLANGTLGRKSRDPSMTDLRTRFEPATYPLPESKSSVGTATVTATTSKGLVADESSAVKAAAGGGGGGKKGKGKGKGKKGNMDEKEVQSAEQVNGQLESEVGKPIGPVEVSRASFVEPIDVPSESVGKTVTPKRSKPERINVDPTPPLASPEEFMSPRSADHIITPPHHSVPLSLPIDRHTLPRGITSRVAHDDRVSFEVPNGNRGRLRVSLAWVRDRTGRSNTQTPSDIPPPLPEKSPPIRQRIINRRIDPEKQARENIEARRLPSSYPQDVQSAEATSPPLSALPDLAPPQGQIQQPYPPIDPFFAQSTRPAYHAPPQYPLGRPFAYPQPQVQPQAWASMPHLAPQVQMQMPIQAMGSLYAQAQSAESFDPPSIRNSPVPGMMSLPNVGMSGMPMGMSMGYGQGQGMGLGGMQNGIIPYSNQSLAQRQHQNQNQGWEDHDHDHQEGRHQVRQGLGLGQAEGRMGYDQSGNYRNNLNQGGGGGDRQSIWKRMFNSNGNPSGGNGWRMNMNPNRNQMNGQYDDQQYHDQNQDPNYRQNQRQRGWGGNGNDKVGKWIRGITPGRAPPPAGGATQNNALTTWRDRRGYKLTQPIWGRMRQYDGPINDERPDGQRQGGMMGWLRGQGQGQGQGKLRGRNGNGNGYDNGYYSTNRPRNVNEPGYDQDLFRKTNNNNDYEREAKRRQKAERRTERERDRERADRARRQAQAQAQGRRGQRKWKDRLPRNTRQGVDGRVGRGREGYRQGQGQATGGTGLFGNLFR